MFMTSKLNRKSRLAASSRRNRRRFTPVFDMCEGRQMLSTFTVTVLGNNPKVVGTLPYEVIQANAAEESASSSSAYQTVTFATNLAGTIQPTNTVALASNVELLGLTQPNGFATGKVVLNGSLLPKGAQLLGTTGNGPYNTIVQNLPMQSCAYGVFTAQTGSVGLFYNDSISATNNAFQVNPGGVLVAQVDTFANDSGYAVNDNQGEYLDMFAWSFSNNMATININLSGSGAEEAGDAFACQFSQNPSQSSAIMSLNLSSAAAFTLNQNIFSGNANTSVSAQGSGTLNSIGNSWRANTGACLVVNGVSLVDTGDTFSGDGASGGVVQTVNSADSFSGVTFTGDTATSVSAQGGSLTCTNDTWTGNSATSVNDTGGTVADTGDTFSGDGGPAVVQTTNAAASFTGATFTGNTATGVLAQGGSLSLESNLWTGNLNACLNAVGLSTVTDNVDTFTNNGGTTMISLSGVQTTSFEGVTFNANTSSTDLSSQQTAYGQTATFDGGTVTGNSGTQFSLTGFANATTTLSNYNFTGNAGIGAQLSGLGAQTYGAILNVSSDVWNGNLATALDIASGYVTLSSVTVENQNSNGSGGTLPGLSGPALVYTTGDPDYEELFVNNSSFINNFNLNGDNAVVVSSGTAYWNYVTISGNNGGMDLPLTTNAFFEMTHSTVNSLNSSDPAFNISGPGFQSNTYVTITSTNVLGGINCYSIEYFTLGIFDVTIVGTLNIHAAYINIFN